MDVKIIYFIIIVFANTLGAISGMGGGAMIKPLFDMFHAHPLGAISFYSSVAVFVMSIVSTIRQVMNDVKIKIDFSLAISVGAVLGGIVGNVFFEFLLQYFANDSLVQLIQIILTIIMLLCVFFATNQNMKTYHLTNKIWYIVIGFVLGFFATLLGIGGGPINVTFLMLFFSIPIKEATVYSIITIFFSQLSKLITIGVTTTFAVYDLNVLAAVVPAATIGGIIGGQLSGVLSEQRVMFVYKLVILFVAIINLFNGIKILF